MARISREEVERVATLARLSLDAGEADRTLAELEALLEYVAVLEQVDTTGVPATSHVLELATPLRDDAITEALDPELAVANAPEHDGTAFVVPTVIEDEGEG
jgi:aspartyl-tRNA(Asn)/glutamyl-tRNA(Gln) amidotransferase subunit C